MYPDSSTTTSVFSRPSSWLFGSDPIARTACVPSAVLPSEQWTVTVVPFRKISVARAPFSS